MIRKKDITIIIPHLGDTEKQEYSLDQCLLSLENTYSKIDVIVAKNGEKSCKHKGGVVVRKQGQCKAVNAAVASTNTKWIMITNDDMVYPPYWYKRLMDTHEKKYLCFSPKLIEPNPGAPTFQVYDCGGAGGDFQRSKFYDFASEHKGEGWRTGFNLPFIIRRDVWDTVGGYDINYDPWGSNSDSDLEYKIKLAGVQPMQNTEAIVYHFSQTSGTFHPKNQGWWNKNWDYFINKWGFERTDDGIWEADFDIPKPPERKFTPGWEGKYL